MFVRVLQAENNVEEEKLLFYNKIPSRVMTVINNISIPVINEY